MPKKPCRNCPSNQCASCPVKSSEIEKAAEQSMKNFGMPEKLYFEDPDTGKMHCLDSKNPSDEAISVMRKIMSRIVDIP